MAQARTNLASLLSDAGIGAAALESRLLLESVTGLSSLELVTKAGEGLAEGAADRLQIMVQRRLCGEPVSRILGRSGFFGLDLLVTPDVLDPRAETEILVSHALDFVRRRGPAKPRILDLGTGSGAILCALLDSLPDAAGIGVDLSFAACKIAKANLARCGLGERSAVICGHWTDALGEGFDLIVSNPPYIALDERPELGPDVAGQDPDLALFGGEDGLDCYREIARGLGRALNSGGGAFFEIGWRQASGVTNILSAAGFGEAHIVRDAENRDRVVGVVNA